MQWLASQVERRYHEHAFIIAIGHDHNLPYAASSSPAYDDTRTATTGQVLQWLPRHILDLGLTYVVSVDMRRTRVRIDIAADVHSRIFAPQTTMSSRGVRAHRGRVEFGTSPFLKSGDKSPYSKSGDRRFRANQRDVLDDACDARHLSVTLAHGDGPGFDSAGRAVGTDDAVLFVEL